MNQISPFSNINRTRVWPMRRYLCITFQVLLLSVFNITFASAQDFIRLDVSQYHRDTSKEDSTWIMMEVQSDNLTNYSLIRNQGKKVIKATSNNAAGGLIYPTRIDPKEYPIIEWRWKVDGIIEKGNYRKKAGDDYPARIYITFDYDKSNLSFGDRIKYFTIKTFTSYKIPLRALNYIWANQAKKGTIAPNPFTNWVYMIATQSGGLKSGQWIVETQNILEDYRQAFGENPPDITGVAIMTDSDNTGGSATAYYGDIIFKKATDTSSK